MRSLVIGTAGHIDHGKSALVRALTGTDPDRLKEEQARGITIDLGFAHLESDGVNLAFVDVPGHERFVKNMLAGAGGIDLVMLVVAADESVMPQTREHFHICRLLGVAAGAIILTKVDLADSDALEIAKLEVRELAAGSFLAEAPIVEVSSKTGRGLDTLKRVLVEAASSLRERDPDGPARLPIDRVFSVKGFGTVVTGTLVSGAIAEENEFVVLPRDVRVKVRGIQVHGHRAARAAAGNRVAVNLGGIDVADLARGDTLCAPGAFEPTGRLDGVVDMLGDGRPLTHGARIRFHHGTTELLGRVAIAGDRLGERPAAQIPAGGSAYVRIRLEAPAVLTRGDRFILRSYSPSVTIAGGIVLDPHPPRTGIRNPASIARYRRLDHIGSEAAAADAVLAFIDERGAVGLSRTALISRGGLTARAADAMATRLSADGRAVTIANLLVSPGVLVALGDRLMDALRLHHEAQPLSEGLSREEARERIFGRAAPQVFEHVLAALAREGRISGRDRLAIAGHRVSLSTEEARAMQTIEQLFRDAKLVPPDTASVPAAARVSTPVADRVAALLVRQKTLVKLDTLLFHADTLAELKSDVRSWKTNARVDVAGFKERYGISRKFAIPLLEYLDRERVTRRVGDSRVVL